LDIYSSSKAKLYTLLTAVCSCLAMCAGDAGFAERLQGDVKRKWQASGSIYGRFSFSNICVRGLGCRSKFSELIVIWVFIETDFLSTENSHMPQHVLCSSRLDYSFDLTVLLEAYSI